MTCGKCPEGRRFAEGGVYCLIYGMIISREHKCTRTGGTRHDGDGDHSEDGEREAEAQEDSCGAAEQMPGILRGSGERAGLPGMEGAEGRTAQEEHGLIEGQISMDELMDEPEVW